jgi:ribosomal RNA assembly protein
MEQLKIPKQRIPRLVGTKGATKRKIQKLTNTKIKVNSEDGDVFIEGEAINQFNCLNIIKAIGRGFNPDIALKLLNEDYTLEIVPIEEFSRNKRDLIRIRSRLIGTEGKARTNIETMTDTNIVIYGKTVGIIGKVVDVMLARQGIINLLQGSKHGNVYSYIEKQKLKNL